MYLMYRKKKNNIRIYLRIEQCLASDINRFIDLLVVVEIDVLNFDNDFSVNFPNIRVFVISNSFYLKNE